MPLFGVVRRGAWVWRFVPALVLILFNTIASAQPVGADLVLFNGDVQTPNGSYEAIAVKNGVIVGLGESDEIGEYAAQNALRINLNGDTVFPGLYDLHVHPMNAGMGHLECGFPQRSTPSEIQAAVKQCVAKRAKGEWITGGRWDTPYFGDTPPNKAMLDAVAPNNPVALIDISGHTLWVNSKALELAGITASTPNPPNGVIDHDENGELTGVLYETAGALVRGVMPPPSLQRRVKALRWALDTMLSQGITTFTDAAVGKSDLEAYAVLADNGELKQWVRTCQVWDPHAKRPMDLGDFHYRANVYRRPRLSPDCIKIFLDGVPTAAHTAAMLQPYVDSQSGKYPRGMLKVPAKELNAALVKMDAQGFTVKMHAAGDRAVREGLDAIEAARNANGFSGLLHNIAHNSFVSKQDIPRYRKLGATFETSPYIWYPNPLIPSNAQAVGKERMKRWIPEKEALEAGALVVAGSDWPVVRADDPWLAIETLVTRKKPGGKGKALGKAERITLRQAVNMFTVNAARQRDVSDVAGHIGYGMRADILVLNQNPFDVPITQVHDTKVLMTIIDGEVVYRANAVEMGH